MYYKRCVLKRDSTYTTAWIPEQFAHPEKALEIKNEKGK
jgi:hypothetical protein